MVGFGVVGMKTEVRALPDLASVNWPVTKATRRMPGTG